MESTHVLQSSIQPDRNARLRVFMHRRLLAGAVMTPRAEKALQARRRKNAIDTAVWLLATATTFGLAICFVWFVRNLA
jgi:hypothetical protein